MSKHKIDWKLWIGIGISAFFLFLLFRKIDFHKLAAAFRELDYRYIPPALLLTFVSYFLRAVRWKFLLLPIKRTRLANLFPSTLIGYMANNLLPARLGEFVRAYSLGQKEQIGTSAVFASLVVDRLCDGFTVLLVLLITFFTIRLPARWAGRVGTRMPEMKERIRPTSCPETRGESGESSRATSRTVHSVRPFKRAKKASTTT